MTMRAAAPPAFAKYAFKGCKIRKSCQKTPARLERGFLRMATRAGRTTSHPWQTAIHAPYCSISVSFSMIKLENSSVSAIKVHSINSPVTPLKSGCSPLRGSIQRYFLSSLSLLYFPSCFPTNCATHLPFLWLKCSLDIEKLKENTGKIWKSPRTSHHIELLISNG